MEDPAEKNKSIIISADLTDKHRIYRSQILNELKTPYVMARNGEKDVCGICEGCSDYFIEESSKSGFI